MKYKKNTSKNVFSNRNDAVKGTYKYWKETLENDVYNLGMSLAQVREKYNYGKYKPYWLSTNYWKKRFDAGYDYWEQKRKADKDAGTYSGTYKTNESQYQTASSTTTYLIYGLIAVLAIFIIWGLIKKFRKK